MYISFQYRYVFLLKFWSNLLLQAREDDVLSAACSPKKSLPSIVLLTKNEILSFLILKMALVFDLLWVISSFLP